MKAQTIRYCCGRCSNLGLMRSVRFRRTGPSGSNSTEDGVVLGRGHPEHTGLRCSLSTREVRVAALVPCGRCPESWCGEGLEPKLSLSQGLRRHLPPALSDWSKRIGADRQSLRPRFQLSKSSPVRFVLHTPGHSQLNCLVSSQQQTTMGHKPLSLQSHFAN